MKNQPVASWEKTSNNDGRWRATMITKIHGFGTSLCSLLAIREK
jgi:hypothetical protein